MAFAKRFLRRSQVALGRVGVIARVGLAILGICGSATATAGYICLGGTVTRVSNTSGNQAMFTVVVSGGTGPCVGQTISFPLYAAPDADTHKRAYAAVLLAMSTGMKVNIYNYSNDTCDVASYVDFGP